MRSLLAACVVVSFAAAAHAEPKGNAYGYWKKNGTDKRLNSVSVPTTPEPTGALLFAAGLIAAGAATRRRQSR